MVSIQYPDQLQLGALRGRVLRYSPAIARGEKSYDSVLDQAPITETTPANLATSLCIDGMHRPLLDLDQATTWKEAATQTLTIFPETRNPILVPSISGDKWHAYVPDLEYYMSELVEVLKGSKVIEQGWVEACNSRGSFTLRLPGVAK